MNRPVEHSWIILNGKRLPAAEAHVSPLSDGFMFGLGLFETMKVRAGRPMFFSDHFNRLHRSAIELGLLFGPPADELYNRCRDCVAANEVTEAALKLMVFQDVGGVSELILTRPAMYQPEQYARGFRLHTVRDGRRADRLCGLKTMNYIGCLLAKRAVVAAGGDEALFIDRDGRVLEGAASNVFVVRDGLVYTPALDQGILPGTARARVLSLLGKECREGLLPAELLATADEVFITNALLGVMPVARIDERVYDRGAQPVTESVMKAYRALETQSGDAFHP